jgi:hypothetical protein
LPTLTGCAATYRAAGCGDATVQARQNVFLLAIATEEISLKGNPQYQGAPPASVRGQLTKIEAAYQVMHDVVPDFVLAGCMNHASASCARYEARIAAAVRSTVQATSRVP